MTDREKLEKIVAEIERLIGDYNIKTEKYRGRNEQAHQYYGGKRDALSEMLKSIVSMQKEAKKEAVIKVEKIMAGIDANFPKSCEEVRNCDPHFAVNIKEESNNVVCWNKMSEKEKSDFLYDLSHKEEPVSEDLEKAAINAANEDMQGRQIMEASNDERQRYSRIFRRGFKAGDNWQKERVLKAMDLGEPPYLISVEQAYYDVKKLLEG